MQRATPFSRILVSIFSLVLIFGSVPALAQEGSPEASPIATETVAPVATPPEEATPPVEEAVPPVDEAATPPLVGPSTPDASPAASPVADAGGTVDLDVLFIGAHPDDEAWALAAYGQWNEYDDVQVGVITITRGEGGGNAIGTEEGPALGLLREDEERRAVGVAGIDHVYNLDEVDFYYNVSAELTSNTWGYDETLEKVMRVVRATQPEVIITMNPAPTPGQHGHHQVAARLAVDAYLNSGNPDEFPGQVSDEGFEAWSVSRLFRSGFEQSDPGPSCAETIVPADPTDVVFGVWEGTTSDANGGRTWGSIARDGQRTYASQGWAGFPDVSENPDELGCTVFTLIDSRTPYDPAGTSTTAALEGAVVQAEGGLPVGTELYISTDAFEALPGSTLEATVHSDLLDGSADAVVELTAPDGWMVEDGAQPGSYVVTVPEDATPGERVQLSATLTSAGATGMTTEVVAVSSTVSGMLEPLQEVAYFREWVDEVGVQALDNLIFPVFSMGSGETHDITIEVSNNSDEAASGTVEIALPAGFESDAASVAFTDLGAGETEPVTFSVTNTDTALATSNEGGEEGTYAFTITTTTDSSASTQDAGINLVPTTVVPRAETAPVVDGAIGEGEYTGEALDLSRVWEGQPVDSPEDGSGTAYVSYDDEGIYIAVQVTDEALGTVLPESDAKRHWRTDSVEIAIDPLGTAGNTSATFKVGVFPTTEEGEPAAYRDADAFQGPISDTAPGMQVASEVTEPYTGYVLEVMIPYEALPADIDPENAAMNIFIYDSDTQDLTGQTRLGWSTWNGVQGDPYRWGVTQFEGFVPSEDARTEPEEPVMPLEAAQSVNSPQSIRQSASDGVGLGGHPLIPEGGGVTIGSVAIQDDVVVLDMTLATTGDLYIAYVVDGTVEQEIQESFEAGEVEMSISYAGDGELLISFIDEQGRVQAIVEPVAP